MMQGSPASELPDLIQHLNQRLELPLPGKAQQFRMAHLSRIAEMPMRSDVRNAAVLILLYEQMQSWHLVLIRRKTIEGDVHAGQISFPGGRARKHETLEEAALRESYEEIGSPSEMLRVIGQLTNLHIPVSNHLVFPFVAYLSDYRGWTAQESEVDMILEVPIKTLLKDETRVIASIQLKDGLVLPNVPCYEIEGHLIWGATAMILSEFIAILGEVTNSPGQ